MCWAREYRRVTAVAQLDALQGNKAFIRQMEEKAKREPWRLKKCPYL